MGTLGITLLLGVHGDPRLVDIPIIFGLGSYIPHPIPASFGYVYVLLHNEGQSAAIVQGIGVENAQGRVTYNLDLPLNDVRGYELAPGATLALGFARHLFTRCLHWGGLDEDGTVQHCRVLVDLEGGTRVASALTCLDLDHPSNPLEDLELLPYAHFFLQRASRFRAEKERLENIHGSLPAYADLHKRWGLRPLKDDEGQSGWLLREYLPQAAKVWLTTDKLHFQRWAHHAFVPVEGEEGWWELRLPPEALEHGTYIELRVLNSHAEKAVKRVPAMAQWVEQDPLIPTQWCARVWNPPMPYVWQHALSTEPSPFPRIYEAHIGMAQPSLDRNNVESVGSYADFARHVLPRIKAGGYTHVQLMGVLEHPLYKSFGYQVSSYFAPSSRFGSVHDFMALVDAAHGLGLKIILDIPHSHSCPNTEQGLARYDGSPYFFAAKGNQWGTESFDYGLDMTRRFLLSNCRYWLEEFRVDGFRFDAVGNMIYLDHGFGDDFSHVGRCFFGKDEKPRADEHGLLYLALVNSLIHEIRPHACSIAEEFSGMPGLTCLPHEGGLGFDYRFAMGIPDFWGKFIKNEEDRNLGTLWHEMTNHRRYDRTISYVECHDQSINGKDAMIWRIMGDAMYTGMGIQQQSWTISRGMALYKLMRCITLCTADKGYLNFMGAEFGHPEWLDDTSFGHRQWHLGTDTSLKYPRLAAFDKACLHTVVAEHMDDMARAPLFRHMDETRRTLAFERGRLLLAFNFHELEASQDLHFLVTPGKYVEILSSDEKRFDGHGNLLAQGLEHFTDAHSGVDRQGLSLYLPPLTCLVLLRA